MNRQKKMKSVPKNDDGQGFCRDFSSGKYVEVAVKTTKIDQEKRDIKEIAQHSRRDDQNMMMTIAVTKTTPRLIFMKHCYNMS
ncbi:hypothetical protein T02_3845 [Trichinella nativa]|uniref:Uncharacterized protein n=1 Tax=Trichinella nativa TaxID=6335 RepID=A0A0V1KSC0_9BILA|nr:hypothetical protein T02_3845 [Trichinella nativa]